jgi:hypothetical protein
MAATVNVAAVMGKTRRRRKPAKRSRRKVTRRRKAKAGDLEEAAARARAVEVLRDMSPTDVLDYVQAPAHRDHVSREYGLTPQQRKALDRALLGNPGHNPATGRAFRAWKERQTRQAIRERERRELSTARERVRAAGRAKRAAIREVRAWCRTARRRVREAARAEREAIRSARARLREQSRTLAARYAAKRASVLELCGARLAGVKRRGTDEQRKAIGELEQLRRDLAVVRQRTKREREESRKRVTAKERARESDDQVRANLPPELLPVFAKYKHQAVAGPRRTRTEAFLEFIEENPDIVEEIAQQRAEALLAADVAELRRQEREQARELRKARPRPKRRRAAAAGVPF